MGKLNCFRRILTTLGALSRSDVTALAAGRSTTPLPTVDSSMARIDAHSAQIIEICGSDLNIFFRFVFDAV